jgi:hypothetical protein
MLIISSDLFLIADSDDRKAAPPSIRTSARGRGMAYQVGDAKQEIDKRSPWRRERLDSR